MLDIVISSVVDSSILLWYLKKFPKRRFFLLRLFFMVFSMVSYIWISGFMKESLLLIRFVIYVLFNVFFSKFLFHDLSVKGACSVSITLVMAAFFAESIVSISAMLFTKTYNIKLVSSNFSVWLVLLIISKIMECILLATFKKWKSRCTIEEFLLQIFYSFSVIITLFFLLLLLGTKHDTYTNLIIFLNLILLCISSIGFFIYIRMLHEKSERDRQIAIMEKQIAVQSAHYEKLGIYYQDIRKIHHDLKHYALGLPLTEEGKTSYLRQIDEFFNPYQPVFYSGNEMLDLLLMNKAEACRANHILFKHNISLADCTIAFNTMDLVSIFGNLLDNAINESVKLHKKNLSFPEIILNTIYRNGIFSIKCQNQMLAPPRLRAGKPKSYRIL